MKYNLGLSSPVLFLIGFCMLNILLKHPTRSTQPLNLVHNWKSPPVLFISSKIKKRHSPMHPKPKAGSITPLTIPLRQGRMQINYLIKHKKIEMSLMCLSNRRHSSLKNAKKIQRCTRQSLILKRLSSI
jgi:hypothetical protein